jgi:acyl-CoA reductase-like NAD-dependent aldehyde dehydrogenase
VIEQLEMPKLEMLIGARRSRAADERTIEVEDPSDGSIIARVPAGGATEVDLAVSAARATFESAAWSRMRPIDRSKILERIATMIEDQIQELAMLESFENGMPLSRARAFVGNGAETFRYMAGWCTKLTGKTFPISADGAAYHAYSQPVPVGVVGAIVPWNGPFAMACWKAATALAAGCTIVLKPSELTPLTALRLGEIALEAGLPPGALNVVTGYGHEAGQALVDHPGVDKIAFTGSSRVGKMIVQSAAQTLKRVTLELGGKSPNIIFADADLDRASEGAAMSVFANSGQACIAGSRLYIEAKVFDRVIEKVSAVAKTLTLGHGRAPDTVLGPLISKSHQGRVLDYINKGVSEGGDVVLGGGAHGDIGYFVEPTIFTKTDSRATIMREEIFGPVVVATPFTDVDSVMKEANDTPFGLAAYVWTSDLARAHRLASRCQAGSVWINTSYMVDPAVPFGGFKESGQGRELGEEGIREYTETRSIIVHLGHSNDLS